MKKYIVPGIVGISSVIFANYVWGTKIEWPYFAIIIFSIIVYLVGYIMGYTEK